MNNMRRIKRSLKRIVDSQFIYRRNKNEKRINIRFIINIYIIRNIIDYIVSKIKEIIMIISDTTIRKIIVDNKEQVLDIVSKSIDEYLVDINKQGKVYEVNLVSKVGDYFKK